ncbi:uncharacterized protein LOC126843148 [Adelges cooleyi]|uniref:uncharacterized protein LOC126843148 n=1 Tax=Adelges cooleyi TaxID=133065 RepID=UPI0021801711|nr:uncharacterized protein LOC126843148 [Adelges cooleyi]
MNTKYIIFLCFLTSYLVIQSVAKQTSEEKKKRTELEEELIQSVFDELLHLLEESSDTKLFVNQVNVLWHDNGNTMRASFTGQEIAQMNKDRIDKKKFEEITRKISKKQESDYVVFMNERLLFLRAQNKPYSRAAKL